MLKINILCIGKIKEPYLKEGINEYAKRLSKYCNLNIKCDIIIASVIKKRLTLVQCYNKIIT